MAVYVPLIATGGSNGRMVKIAATSTPGTLLHTATNTSGEFDELYIWLVNSDTVARKVTIEWGGTTSPDDLIEITVQPEAGPQRVVPGIRVNGGVVVRAFCASANVVMALINVNRITT